MLTRLSRRDKWMLSLSAIVLGAGALCLLALLAWYLLMWLAFIFQIRVDL
jgi:hypothetical protein